MASISELILSCSSSCVIVPKCKIGTFLTNDLFPKIRFYSVAYLQEPKKPKDNGSQTYSGGFYFQSSSAMFWEPSYMFKSSNAFLFKYVMISLFYRSLDPVTDQVQLNAIIFFNSVTSFNTITGWDTFAIKELLY